MKHSKRRALTSGLVGGVAMRLKGMNARLDSRMRCEISLTRSRFGN